MTALVIGVVSGLFVAFSLYRTGILAERSGLAVLVAAVAFFYPVFAIQAGAPIGIIGLHAAVFALFCLLAHGAFDAVTYLTGHPGPDWWPLFCGSLDIAAGAAILFLVKTGRIDP